MRLISSLVCLYPGSWRERYGEEMRAVIDGGRSRPRDAIDIIRGALDAWLHPTRPSRVPALAALVGGGLWTVAAVAVIVQPTPPDWPGYLVEVVPIALAAAVVLLAATLGCALRAGDQGGRMMAIAVALTTLGYLAWMVALAATLSGLADGPTLAAAQALAMIGTTLVGMALVAAGDEAVGLLVVVGAMAMVIPWTATWLVYGAAWTLVGTILALEGPRPSPAAERAW